MRHEHFRQVSTMLFSALTASAVGLILMLDGGCANLGPVGDGVTTQAALQGGAGEANPFLAGGSPIALAASVGFRQAYMRSQRNRPYCAANVGIVDSFSWAAASNNLLVVTASAAPMIAIPVGIAVGVAHNRLSRESREAWCHPEYPSCNISNLPAGAASARCIEGELVVTQWQLESSLAAGLTDG